MCSPARMAADDLFEWRMIVSESLPDGEGIVTRSTEAALYRYRITIEWRSGQVTRERSLEVLL